MVIAITITTAAVGMVIVNSIAASDVEIGEQARAAAEFGADNAYLQLLRNTSYTGETIDVNDSTVVIAVTDELGSSPPVKIIESTGTVEQFQRKIRAKIMIDGGLLTITEWVEI